MVINFKEIPKANTGVGNQDTFELFARDFLAMRGLEIDGDPARGTDGGVDLICVEHRQGVFGKNSIRWLVSCKHYAHSGKAISPIIEQNIHDRIVSNNCQGFIGFYSTLASTGLKSILNGLTSCHQVLIYDKEKIEGEIIGIPTMESIFMRYFPLSYKNWLDLYKYNEPVKLFEYFLRKEDIIVPFSGIFGEGVHLIKVLKKFNTLNEAIVDIGKPLYLIDLKSVFNKPLAISKAGLKEIVDAIYNYVTTEIQVQTSSTINLGKAEGISIAGDSGGDSVIIYANGIVTSQNCINRWSELFSTLKNMLT